ncbi:MAG: Lrp/AsnC family transcriptional regulator [Rhodospirillum sp.]|nr:Lrp/AsnC family transcriptional regulator [Rhodospirillum sp.]MCF8488043.1 Lrp/AsnC family transcriptional regulator [Rhodospirillum sp.]MCF8501527.1 Lrp/AsnC family transcriptional regulator [Rhodospirillum sp.]
MDNRDRRIITALQENGRMSNQDLSERVNLSPSPCLRRLRHLEETGVIKGYTAVVDQEACGLPLTAFVSIRLSPHTEGHARTFEDKIRRMDNVLDCHILAGDTDYLLRIVVRDMKEYEALVRTELHTLPGIAGIETRFAYSTVKQSTVFPLKD